MSLNEALDRSVVFTERRLCELPDLRGHIVPGMGSRLVKHERVERSLSAGVNCAK